MTDATEGLLLGVDIGSASSKASLVTPGGVIVASASVAHEMSIPRPGWAEQDADDVWWNDFTMLCRRLFAETGFSGDQVLGVGVSAIGPCALPLDGGGKPLRPGILYGVDGRAAEQIRRLEDEIGRDRIREIAGMDLSSQAVGPKIMWIRDEEPDVWSSTAMVTTASSYVVYRLTGEHVIDHHTAAHTIPLYDAATESWSDTYADMVIEPDRLPRLAWSQERAGSITDLAAEQTGLRSGTPVAVGTVDALSEAIGVGAVSVGDLMLMYGSTAFFILVASDPNPAPGMWLLPGPFPGSRTVAAGMSTTGSLTEWFRRTMAAELPDDEAFETLFASARGVPAGSRGLIVLPYFAGERTPINDPDARGVFAGLSLAHDRADMFRAVLEGVAYGIRHNLEAMAEAGAPVGRVVAVGGGTTGDFWTQIVSDVTGIAQELPRDGGGAVLGDAFLAAVVSGLLDLEDLDGWCETSRVIEPRPSDGTYEEGYRRYRALYPAVSGAMTL
ncbi:MAG: FGGY family carbohydrate kinase [Actinomycetota bacterium]